MKQPLGFVRVVNASDGNVNKVFENVPEGALVHCIARYDSTVTTAYTLISSGSLQAYKVIQSDPPTAIEFVKSADLTMKGDGTSAGTLRVWGWFEAQSPPAAPTPPA